MSANLTTYIREIQSDEDWRIAAELRNPHTSEHPLDGEELRVFATSHPEGMFAYRGIMFEDEKPVAYCSAIKAYWQDIEGLYNVQVSALIDDRELERYEIAFKMLVDKAVKDGALKIGSHWKSTRPEFGAWFESQGFRETMRCPATRLALEQFDISRYQDRIDKLKGEGIGFVTLSQFRDRYPDDWLRRYWRLEMDQMHDVPLPEPFKETPIETFEKQMADPAIDYDHLWVAMDGDVEAGGTQLLPNKMDPSIAATGVTGVRRQYRRRGIATALKAISLEAAKAQGIKHVTTDNEENNPMYQLNIEMGFERYLDFVLVQKTL